MLTLPSLPTDSLYKFLAIVGVVLCLAAAYFPTHNFTEYKKFEVELNTDVERLNMKRYHSEVTLDRIRRTIDIYCALTNTTNNYHVSDTMIVIPRGVSGSPIIDQTLQELSELRNNFLKLKDEVAADDIAIKYRQELQKEYIEVNDMVDKAAEYGFFVGLFMTALGFTLWYYRVQRYQDIIIKHTADSLNTQREQEREASHEQSSEVNSEPNQLGVSEQNNLANEQMNPV